MRTHGPTGWSIRARRTTAGLTLFAVVGLLLLSAHVLAQQPQLKVMTYNIRYQAMDKTPGKDGKLHPWDGRKQMVLAVVQQQDPDIVGFQECQQPQRTYLAESLKEYGSRGTVFWKRSEFELLGSGGMSQWRAPRDPTGVAPKQFEWVRLRWQGIDRELFLFNTHFRPALKEPIRVQLCKNVGDYINQVAGTDAIAMLVGDLNIHDSDSKGIRIIRDTAGMSDPWTDTGTPQRYTWNYWFNPTWSGDTVDWILYRRPLKGQSVMRPDYNVDGEYPSDHTPVFSVLGVE
ncbi:MAG: endonuclease/exonuclease/phosphatase family protein [Armatimonadota bacterium]|jgi:endonuclease/exonuclease/phosphatase family metal-dependent hydrolase